MKWTEAQGEAIEIRGKNVLVSAAAGSGKTAVLVERIKQLIIKDQVPLDEMLVVTFSNAAASEMREKIICAISAEIDGGENPNNQFLREQLSKVHKANISTFHAFSMEVIRRYFYIIDIEPNFKICDEAQKSILQANAMDQLFSQLFQSGEQEFLWFLNEYGKTKNENIVKGMILNTHAFIQSVPEPYVWLFEQIEMLSYGKEKFLKTPAFLEMQGNIERGLKLAIHAFIKVEELLEINGLAGLVKKSKEDVDLVEGILLSFQGEDFEGSLGLLSQIKYQQFRPSKEEKESYEEIKEAVTYLRSNGKEEIGKLVSQYGIRGLDDYIEEMNQTYRGAFYLGKLVESFNKIYREKKEEKGLIDFSDIEHYGLDILKEDSVAQEYREKFQYIFIDEYQDSNIVQETLISKIKGENNLFMVGDVKQSIYKFRLAEPEIFIEKYQTFKMDVNGCDQKIDLNKNYRSKGRIIDSVNDVFTHIMKKESSGLDYDKDAELYKGVDYNGELDYQTEIHLVDDKLMEIEDTDDEVAEMQRVEIEAFTAGEIIKAAIGKPIYDGKKQEIRPLQKKDIVVLLRGAKGVADIYAEALLKEGIPAFMDTSDGYFDTVEIEVFMNLLKVIDNYKQDLPLLSVLRSPIFGFTISQLVEIRLQDRKITYEEAFRTYGEEGEVKSLKEKVRETLEKIEKWGKAATFMPFDDFLWKIIRETGYYEYISAIPGGQQRQANLRALVDKAVQFQNTQNKGLYQFTKYIDAIKKEKVPTGQVKLLGENDDVVRIMTIHKSKGLEFPMVLLGGLGKKFIKGSRSGAVSLHKDIGIGIPFIDRENYSFKKTIMQMVIEGKKSREDLAEEIRILYVAFTRAMDKLVLLGTLADVEKSMKKYALQEHNLLNGGCYLDFIMPILKDIDIQLYHHNRSGISSVRMDKGEKRATLKSILKEDKSQLEAETLVEIEKRLRFIYPYQDSLSLKSKFSVSELNRGVSTKKRKAKLTVPNFYQEKGTFTGAERGTILHTVMEHLDFSKMQDDKFGNIVYIKEFMDKLVKDELLTIQERAAVEEEKILRFFQSQIGKRASGAPEVYRENAFNIAKEMCGEQIIVQGAIDCYFQEGDQLILLDYKSNYLMSGYDEKAIKELVEGYKGQLCLYKEALEKIKGKKVGEVYLYLFSIDREVKVEL